MKLTCNKIYKIPKSGNPDYSIAFKSNGSGEITTVRNIEWNVSKHKLLIPTIVFDKIILGYDHPDMQYMQKILKCK